MRYYVSIIVGPIEVPHDPAGEHGVATPVEAERIILDDIRAYLASDYLCDRLPYEVGARVGDGEREDGVVVEAWRWGEDAGDAPAPEIVPCIVCGEGVPEGEVCGCWDREAEATIEGEVRR